MTYIPEDGHRRWAGLSTTHQGAPGGPGTPWCLVLTRWPPSGSYLLQYFFIYSKIILRKFSAYLELCRIGISDVAFSGPEFQLPVFSLCRRPGTGGTQTRQ